MKDLKRNQAFGEDLINKIHGIPWQELKDTQIYRSGIWRIMDGIQTVMIGLFMISMN